MRDDGNPRPDLVDTEDLGEPAPYVAALREWRTPGGPIRLVLAVLIGLALVVGLSLIPEILATLGWPPSWWWVP